MSEIVSIFGNKTDFQKESFYYFLPNLEKAKKQKIGEKIIKFNGVNKNKPNIDLLIYNYIIYI
jgi:hypothetical protein